MAVHFHNIEPSQGPHYMLLLPIARHSRMSKADALETAHHHVYFAPH